jgi:hypothetical protein
MAIVTETITVTVTGVNPQTFTVGANVNTDTGAGTGPISLTFTGTKAGTDSITATMTSHTFTGNTSNVAEIVWQPINGQIAVASPFSITTYGNPNKTTGWPGFYTGGSSDGTGRTFPYTTNGCTSLVWNQVTANNPINPFCAPNNVSGCGGGYKADPMLVVQQTSTGTGAGSLSINGTNNNPDNGGNWPGFVLDCNTSLIVSQAGTYTFYVNSADVAAFAVYIGGGATFSSASYGSRSGNSGNSFPATGPTTTSAKLAIVETNPNTLYPPNVSTYVTFPKPGVYPIEIVYNQFYNIQFSGDNNGYFQLTYGYGQLNQNLGNGTVGVQNFPVALATAPPAGSPPTSALQLTPVGGATNLQLQGGSESLTLTIQNVPYTNIVYCPILEGTQGSLSIFNNSSTSTFSFPEFPNASDTLTPVDYPSAATNVFTLSGDNTAWMGLFTITPNATTSFSLNYNGGPFTFATPGTDIATTNLQVTANDIAWFNPVNKSYDVFTRNTSGQGGIGYSIEMDYMTMPTVQSVSPTSMVADGKTHPLTINLSRPMSPQQQGSYGTGNTILPYAQILGGATFASAFTPILDSNSFLLGWTTSITVPLSTSNSTLTLTMWLHGTLTYLSGNTFVNNGAVNYIGNGPTLSDYAVVGTIALTGSQYVAPVAEAFSITGASGTQIGSNNTLSGTVYTFDNNPVNLQFQYKFNTSGTIVNIGGLQTSPNGGHSTITVGGKTAYQSIFNLSWAPGTIQVASESAAQVLLGYTVTDPTSGLSTQYFSSTIYTLPYTIIVVCFTGNVGVKTPDGFTLFEELPREEQFKITNKSGTFDAQLITHEYAGWMLEFADGKLVTLDHPMGESEGVWVDAEVKFVGAKRVWYEGTVYNMHVLADKYDDQHYILDTGDVAHNKGGGGGGCPAVEMFISQYAQVYDITDGMLVKTLAGNTEEYLSTEITTEHHRVEWHDFSEQPCHRLLAENGAEVTVSASTPVPTRQNIEAMNEGVPVEQIAVFASEMRAGMDVITDIGYGPEWSRLVETEAVGMRRVARVYCGGRNFATGTKPGKYIYTHNVQPIVK